MKKKSLIVLFTLFLVLFIHTVCFASNEMKRDFSNMTNSLEKTMDSTGEVIKDGAESVGNTVEGAVEKTGNFIENTGNNIKNTYEASRTSTGDMQKASMNSYVPWIVIGLAFAVIIGLTWYYLAQTNSYHEE